MKGSQVPQSQHSLAIDLKKHIPFPQFRDVFRPYGYPVAEWQPLIWPVSVRIKRHLDEGKWWRNSPIGAT